MKSLPIERKSLQMEKLIQVVKANPVLYDPNHEYFGMTIFEKEIWKKVAKMLNYTSGEAVEEDWKKLRDSHKNALRRRNQRVTTDYSDKEFPYMNQMEFLTPFVNPRKLNEEEKQIQHEEIQTRDHGQEKYKYSIEDPENIKTIDVTEIFEKNVYTVLKLMRKDLRGVARKASNDIADIRGELRKLIEVKEDPLHGFFKGLYITTKDLPPLLQAQVKRNIFLAVSAAEEGILYQAFQNACREASSPTCSGTASSSPVEEHRDTRRRTSSNKATPAKQSMPKSSRPRTTPRQGSKSAVQRPSTATVSSIHQTSSNAPHPYKPSVKESRPAVRGTSSTAPTTIKQSSAKASDPHNTSVKSSTSAARSTDYDTFPVKQTSSKVSYTRLSPEEELADDDQMTPSIGTFPVKHSLSKRSHPQHLTVTGPTPPHPGPLTTTLSNIRSTPSHAQQTSSQAPYISLSPIEEVTHIIHQRTPSIAPSHLRHSSSQGSYTQHLTSAHPRSSTTQPSPDQPCYSRSSNRIDSSKIEPTSPSASPPATEHSEYTERGSDYDF